ncbi:hypothetical protein [Sinimarinibacterium thermocellulolyticum]|uniref:Alkaline phosphatase n=1 Tax=Sinimarinibacterium thermocellulolyticum TaxID=3170016 RepID=A0ABV2A9E7_9GAMM
MNRRKFLQAGSGLVLPAWLAACSGGDGASPPTARSGPRGVHASWSGDAHTTRAITWFTDGLAAPEGVVEYGNNDLSRSAVATQQQAYDSAV